MSELVAELLSPHEVKVRTLHVGYARVLLDHLREQGVNVLTLFDRDELARLQGMDELSRCSLSDWHMALARAEAHLGCSDLALALAESIKPWHTGLVGFMMMTASDLQDVGGVLARFQHLLNDVYRAELGLIDSQYRMALKPCSSLLSPALAMLSIGSWAWHTRWLTGHSDLVFDASFTFPEPADIAPFQRMFGGVLKFSQPQDELRASQSYLFFRIRQQDPVVHKLLRQQAMAQLERLHEQSGSFLARIEKMIKLRLGMGTLSLKDVADELGMSSRNLQHRLDQYGMHFRELLDGVRQSQAKHQLRSTSMSLAEITDALGFANQTTFQHAFKRWTGMTPGDFRKKRNSV